MEPDETYFLFPIPWPSMRANRLPKTFPEAMNKTLIKCPCCDRMVPANDIELAFRKPDDVASMEEYEIEEKCKYNDDIYICEEKYFYIRCTLPLPVHDKGEEYSLGVWVQISENSFNRVWELWEDENQSSEPPIQGLLANNIPLTQGSENAEVLVQLTGPATRPKAFIQDQNCTLYQEQTCGIAIHRAGEYSDLCRK